MPEDIPTDAHKHVTLIPTDRIRVLNPKVRNRRTFEEMVENIARIGNPRLLIIDEIGYRSLPSGLTGGSLRRRPTCSSRRSPSATRKGR